MKPASEPRRDAFTPKFGLDDKPPIGPLLLYSLQWWVVSLPCVVIMGVVLARMHYQDAALQALYLQRVFGITGAIMAFQALFGHRLPLIAGPASTLLVGLAASVASGPATQYTAIIVGGAFLAVAGFSGFLEKMRTLFTPRIVATVLLLIALTLAPTILRLTLPEEGADQSAAFTLGFAILLTFAMLVTNNKLPGVAKSLTVLLGLAGGTILYSMAAGFPGLRMAEAPTAPPPLFSIEFDAGVTLSFLFCFLALAINEIGSIESLGRLLDADNMDKRMRLGTGYTGVANMVAGCLGVVGPVDFSMSAGLIPASGCASRYAMVPAGAGLFACAFSPAVVSVLSVIPGPVMGSIMLYLMASQLASGLTLAVGEKGVASFVGGLVVGLPIMLSLIIAFAPPHSFAAFPALLRPIVGNGFVVGTIAVIVLEHGIFRGK